eukprot:TRINITY_DN8055_c0_g2_i1.p2 TRINITY_DN8055_c0_g2~~TRINITY_DN8055_c0_g2_i1.p2  ORF type:complete len:104 (-),score=21.09 TRINITY_DN8055_c0_g2_i1:404-715(-)
MPLFTTSSRLVAWMRWSALCMCMDRSMRYIRHALKNVEATLAILEAAQRQASTRTKEDREDGLFPEVDFRTLKQKLQLRRERAKEGNMSSCASHSYCFSASSA